MTLFANDNYYSRSSPNPIVEKGRRRCNLTYFFPKVEFTWPVVNAPIGILGSFRDFDRPCTFNPANANSSRVSWRCVLCSCLVVCREQELHRYMNAKYLIPTPKRKSPKIGIFMLPLVKILRLRSPRKLYFEILTPQLHLRRDAIFC